MEISIVDVTASGERTGGLKLSILTSTITLRELIRKRVYEEVREHNMKMPTYFNSLVEPSDAERTLNGFKLRKPRQLDWEPQVEVAIKAFEKNGFFVLVDDKQVDSLDSIITLKLESDIMFMKLVQLVGG